MGRMCRKTNSGCEVGEQILVTRSRSDQAFELPCSSYGLLLRPPCHKSFNHKAYASIINDSMLSKWPRENPSGPFLTHKVAQCAVSSWACRSRRDRSGIEVNVKEPSRPHLQHNSDNTAFRQHHERHRLWVNVDKFGGRSYL